MTTTRKVAPVDATRDLAILRRAYEKIHRLPSDSMIVRMGADAAYAELRAAVYAVTPGRQNARNIADLLHRATLAVARTIRRRAAK